MGSVLDLGPQFSQNVYRKTFLLRNAGRRHQNLVWSSEGFPLTSKSSYRRQTVTQETKAGKATKSKVDDSVSSVSWLQKFVVFFDLDV